MPWSQESQCIRISYPPTTADHSNRCSQSLSIRRRHGPSLQDLCRLCFLLAPQKYMTVHHLARGAADCLQASQVPRQFRTGSCCSVPARSLQKATAASHVITVRSPYVPILSAGMYTMPHRLALLHKAPESGKSDFRINTSRNHLL